MADHENEHVFGFASRTRVSAQQITPTWPTSPRSIGEMRTRLAAINPTLYTAAYLNTMTKNDMLFAIRQSDAAGTV